MILAIGLIFLNVNLLLMMGALTNSLINQRMATAFQNQNIAFNTAAAGIIAEEMQINNQIPDLSHLQGTLDYRLISDSVDNCQQHIFTILSQASYQHARIAISSAYIKARQPPLPGCADNVNSHQLWWRQVSFE